MRSAHRLVQRPGSGLAGDGPATRRAPASVRVERRPPRVVLGSAAVLLSVLLLAGVVLDLVATALVESRLFTGYAFNGAFQLSNPLRRLHAGQVPGEDFVFFHGIAVPLVHYPVYLLAGADLFASELARRLVSPAVALAALYAVLLAGTRRPRSALVWTAALTGLLVATGLDDSVIAPHNSLLALRSSGPLLVAAVLLLPPERLPGRAGRWWLRGGRDLAAGAACAGAFLLGTEAGLALAPGVAAAYLLALGQPWRRRVAALGRVALGGGVALVLLLLAVTRGSVEGAVALLRYSLVEVPGDQFWYFGAPPNPFVDSLGDLLVSPMALTLLPLAALTGLVVLLLARRLLAPEIALGLVALAVTSLVSTVSYLGIADARYLQPAQRSALVVGAVLVHHLVRSGALATVAPTLASVPLRARHLPGLVVGSLALGAVVVAPGALTAPARAAEALSAPAALGAVWQAHGERLDALVGEERCESPDEPLLWSTYANVGEERLGCVNPHTDYVIHALGPRARADYLDTFLEAEPPFVQTARRRGFAFEDWLRYTTWPWYAELLARYEPAGETPQTVLWRRLPEAAPDRLRLEPSRELPVGPEVVVHPDPATDLLEVELEYEVDNPAAWVPVLGDLPRYVVEVDGTALHPEFAVDPGQDRVRFPVLLDGAGPVRLRFVTRSPVPGADWSVRSLAVREARLPGDTEAALLS